RTGGTIVLKFELLETFQIELAIAAALQRLSARERHQACRGNVMRRNHCAFLLPFCVLAATALLAQVIHTSTIVGTVTDPQGAVVPGAEITLTNVDTGVQWKATTNANGDYQFPNLIAAHYKVGVAKEGFAHTISTAGLSKTARISALTSD